jgi:hypothetical protein
LNRKEKQEKAIPDLKRHIGKPYRSAEPIPLQELVPRLEVVRMMRIKANFMRFAQKSHIFHCPAHAKPFCQWPISRLQKAGVSLKQFEGTGKSISRVKKSGLAHFENQRLACFCANL